MTNNIVVEEIELEAWVKQHGATQPPLAQRYVVRIDDRSYKVHDPVITGGQLLDEASKRPVDEYLIFQVLHNGQLEEITDETVDLRAPGIERFITCKSDRSFRFVIDGRRFEWGAPIITGLKLKELAGVDPKSYGVWLEVHGAEDRPIADNESVDLQAPGVERFFTGKKTTTEG
ncbi:multiubiquitin domain-containing protein [Tolypothrix sp. VBCCA 56010]|uniref:multiubiquitin domain-containing protein n=1 Tax=Tolypothrix sp. VBCCA 56010 TaxID=3137731 RepID=UPI003D7C8CCF